MLRVTVESGGCHGYQYLMSLTESFDPEEDAYLPSPKRLDVDDRMFERDGTKVVVDTISLGLITGSKVDYSTELIGSQFKIVDNPAASSNCGYDFDSWNLLIGGVVRVLIWILVDGHLMRRLLVHSDRNGFIIGLRKIYKADL
jgi:iron-sulfur cluster assembly accessory protein